MALKSIWLDDPKSLEPNYGTHSKYTNSGSDVKQNKYPPTKHIHGYLFGKYLFVNIKKKLNYKDVTSNVGWVFSFCNNHWFHVFEKIK
jgi:hypothetical protein